MVCEGCESAYCERQGAEKRRRWVVGGGHSRMCSGEFVHPIPT